MAEVTNEKDPLEACHFSQPLHSPFLRCRFLDRVFDLYLSTVEIERADRAYEAFFSHYHALCRLALPITQGSGIQLTHADVCQIIGLLKQDDGASTDAVEAILKIDATNMYYSSTPADLVMNLCVFTWLMLHTGQIPGEISLDEPIRWDWQGECRPQRTKQVPKLIESCFSPSNSRDIVKLPQTFTAANLERIGGIKILWTNNLADHLLLRDDDTKLVLFHQVSILELHIRSRTSHYPKGLLVETIRTIALLLPPELGQANKWYEKERLACGLDQGAGQCKRLNSSERQIDNFRYWRDRLVLLKRTYDEKQPRTMSQLYHDDRNKAQWLTFWVAVLVFVFTIFFGVVQSTASIVQAWASVKALNQA